MYQFGEMYQFSEMYQFGEMYQFDEMYQFGEMYQIVKVFMWEKRTSPPVVFLQPKGELVGPGNFGNQDTLVANTQRSFSLKLADFLGTKVSALLGLVSK